MSELHNARGGKVLKFDLLRPHEEARLKCSECGNTARHVWPQGTPVNVLECVCGKVGTLDYDLPPACGHDARVYLWYRTVGDSDTIDMSQPFCARCELASLRAALQSHPDFAALASAMRKMLPAPLLAEVIAHLDPLTPFVEFLKSEAKVGDSTPSPESKET